MLLKLANSLTASEQPDFNKRGYLVRKITNPRISQEEKQKLKQELAQLRTEADSRTRAKENLLEYLRAKSKRGGDMEVESARGNLEDTPERLDSSNVEADAPSADHTPNDMHNTPSDMSVVARDVTVDHWPYFDEVFMVSALSGDGIPKLKVGGGGGWSWKFEILSVIMSFGERA